MRLHLVQQNVSFTIKHSYQIETVIQAYVSLNHIPTLASTPVDMFRHVQNGRQSQSLTEMTFVT